MTPSSSLHDICRWNSYHDTLVGYGSKIVMARTMGSWTSSRILYFNQFSWSLCSHLSLEIYRFSSTPLHTCISFLVTGVSFTPTLSTSCVNGGRNLFVCEDDTPLKFLAIGQILKSKSQSYFCVDLSQFFLTAGTKARMLLRWSVRLIVRGRYLNSKWRVSCIEDINGVWRIAGTKWPCTSRQHPRSPNSRVCYQWPFCLPTCYPAIHSDLSQPTLLCYDGDRSASFPKDRWLCWQPCLQYHSSPIKTG